MLRSFLAKDHLLCCHSIGSSTIKIYLHNTETFVSRFGTVNRNARKKERETKLCPPVASVVGIVKKYEEMKNCCESFTLDMLHLLFLKLYFFQTIAVKLL